MFLRDALTFSADGRTLVKCDESYEGKVVVPGSMRELGLKPKSALARILSMIIPSKVTIIGKDAFLDCQKITSVVLPDSIRVIGESAFSSCSSLTSITIPNGIKKIDSGAFYNCSKLASVDIPASVKEIGTYAFGKCVGIKRYNVDCNNSNYCSEDGVLYSKGKDILYNLPACIEKFTIPDSVLRLDIAAFRNCEKLTSIEIPKCIFQAELARIFHGCKGNKGFVVDKNNPVYREINGAICSKDGKELIRVPEGVETFKIPDSVVAIKEAAMWGCDKLTEIEIPVNVTRIEEEAFVDTYGNRRYVVAKDHPCFCEMNGAICSKDGKSLLHVPNGLEKFTVPDGILYINRVNNDDESIAFESDEKLTSVTIPSCVEQIGENTFMDCDNLVEIHMKHQTPLEEFSEDAVFDYEKITLFVPRGSEAAYRAHPLYSQFVRVVGE